MLVIRMLAVLVDVHDGDTAHFDLLESANRLFGTEHWIRGRRYRFARINAPELPTPAGLTSATALKEKAASYPRENWTLAGSKFDPYGRFIAEVFAPDGTNINDWLIENGYAAAVTYKLMVHHP